VVFENIIVKLSKMDLILKSHLSKLVWIFIIEKVCKSNNYLRKTDEIHQVLL